jgi:hypothetical protein
MVSPSGARWAAALAGLLALLAAPSCRRTRFPSRGDAAAVVVVVPRNDAAPAPTVPEQEPNDRAEQAQVLGLGGDSPQLVLEGELPLLGAGKSKDVDFCKLLVPGGPAQTPPSAVDSGRAAEDPRLQARRLSVELAAAGTASLSLQLLDEASHVLEGIAVEGGETGGMPNLAVVPGQTYYLRIRAIPKAAKAAAAKPAVVPSPVCRYRLAVQLGDFEVADEREPNGARDLANPVAVVGSAEWSGFHGWSRDQDFFRIARPEVLSALDVDLDAVDGVGASLQVVDDAGSRRALAKGRKGERLALRNVVLRPASPDAGPASRFVYLVVRAETGSNRAQRYVLRVAMGGPQANVEVEPNDSPAAAMPVSDGTLTGYLPVSDTDFFRYEGQGPRDLTVEVAFPARVRGQVAWFRPGTVEPLGKAEAKKPRQTVTLSAIPTLGQPVVVRISQPKADGNANAPYTLRLASSTSSPQASTATPAVPAPAP